MTMYLSSIVLLLSLAVSSVTAEGFEIVLHGGPKLQLGKKLTVQCKGYSKDAERLSLHIESEIYGECKRDTEEVFGVFTKAMCQPIFHGTGNFNVSFTIPVQKSLHRKRPTCILISGQVATKQSPELVVLGFQIVIQGGPKLLFGESVTVQCRGYASNVDRLFLNIESEVFGDCKKATKEALGVFTEAMCQPIFDGTENFDVAFTVPVQPSMHGKVPTCYVIADLVMQRRAPELVVVGHL